MIDGGLFTRNFLIEGIRETANWKALDAVSVEAVEAFCRSTLDALAARKNPNEAQTEEDVVYPVLEQLGWAFRDVQPNASVKARNDVPDALLFESQDKKETAGKLDPWQRFRHGLCIVEAKRWGRPLDREEKARKGEEGTPSSQMLRYLRRVDDVTKGGLRWGILTNGRVWRLYHQGALSVAEDFLEIDIGKALDVAGCGFDLLDKRPDLFSDDRQWREHVLRLFALLFARTAFLTDEQGETFHQLALREGRRWEAKVAKSLSEQVFDAVFPTLADALAKADPLRPRPVTADYLSEVRQGALILLYRLLFVLYAEDRNLLPDESGAYAPYCLTRVRLDVAERERMEKPFPRGVVTLWPRLTTIFAAIASGNDDLGIPPYNGGLFDPGAAPILSRVQLPDAEMAKVIFGLSHEPDDGSGRGPRYINYRDLSVQQLGAVYERILEHGLRTREDGSVEIDADDAARHVSGSYYTPEELVSLIIERAVGPLVAERIARFRAAAERLAGDRRAKAERLTELEALDPASAILSLKICDPAMGSGHFLVSLVDWLSDKVLDAKEEARQLATALDYASPLVDRIAAIRETILAEARARKWPIVEAQLDDRHIVRRMVLKRVVYGVDKNPMAVELAKVALWLHSFTVGAPLSFLDHHLRAGDSVVGGFVRPTVDALQARGALFNVGQITRVEQVAGVMAEIEETTDNDIAEVNASKSKFEAVADTIRPVEALFSLLTAERMMGVFDAAPKVAPDLRKLVGKPEKQLAKARADRLAFERGAAFRLALEGIFGDPMRIADGSARIAPPEFRQQLALVAEDEPDQSSLFPGLRADDRRRVLADTLVQEAQALAATHRFFHWEIGFPNVWSNLLSAEPAGGFDAVIGNPPYVRQELLGPEVKRALKCAYSAFDGMADLYVYFYEQGLKLLKPGGRLSYVVTNKWLKAGYAEELRSLFAENGWLEFVADFGHAKHFFPDADVFPSVLVIRKPLIGEEAPADAKVCVIPRDAVPRKGLGPVVVEATFPLPRAMFTKESWVLEPKPVMDLMEKIRRNGVPLMEIAGRSPINGIKTGLNDAFVLDREKYEKIRDEEPHSGVLISPFRRGQDINRWISSDPELYMIVLSSRSNSSLPWADMDESSAEHIFRSEHPILYSHLSQYREKLELRESRGKFWWELQSAPNASAYAVRSIIYQEIQFYPCYSYNDPGIVSNNKTFLLPSNDPLLLGILNSPLMWWHNWRFLPHMKDEALSPMSYRMELLPIAESSSSTRETATHYVEVITSTIPKISVSNKAISDWLSVEFDLIKLGDKLSAAHLFDSVAFVAAVRKALPKSRKLSAADIGRLKQEHADTVEPARAAAAEVLRLERRLSDLVNEAYGLTPEDVALMWSTAPPRMPFTPEPKAG